MPSGPAAHLGTSIHAGTAAFDQAELDGEPITADDAAGALVTHPRDKNAEVDRGRHQPSRAERIALALHSRYCAEIAPRQHYIGVEVAR
ncbi:hypothetical protein ACU4GD_27865 [Cupriavidus basilensis]